MSNRSDFEEFLMFELKDIRDILLDENERAYGLLVLLSVGGESMQESFVITYAKVANVSLEILINWAAMFHGADFLKVICDCGEANCFSSIVQNDYLCEHGAKEKFNDTPAYRKSLYDILALRRALGL